VQLVDLTVSTPARSNDTYQHLSRIVESRHVMDALQAMRFSKKQIDAIVLELTA